MVHVAECRDVDQLQSFRVLWRSLWERTPRAMFQQSFEWFQHYLKGAGRDHQLRVMIVSSLSRPVGIIPFVVKRIDTRVGSLRALTLPSTDLQVATAPIGPYPTASLVSALRHVKSTPRDWDLIDLRSIDSGASGRRIANALKVQGLAARQRTWQTVSAVNLNPDEPLQTIPLTRSNTRMRLVRHRAAGAASGDCDGGWSLFETAQSILKTSRTRADWRLLEAAHGEASSAGMADTSVLYDGTRPVAAAYSYVQRDGTVEVLKIGTVCGRPRAAGELCNRMLVDSRERGDLRVMSSCELPCDAEWNVESLRTNRYTHYPVRSARSQILRVAHWVRSPAASETPVVDTADVVDAGRPTLRIVTPNAS